MPGRSGPANGRESKLLAYQRVHHGDPYMTLVKAKEMQRVALRFWHVGAARTKADREAQDAAPIAHTLPSHTRSDNPLPGCL
jgi:hypothetical protein